MRPAIHTHHHATYVDDCQRCHDDRIREHAYATGLADGHAIGYAARTALEPKTN